MTLLLWLFALQDPIRISGRVVDANGEPIAGVVIRAIDLADWNACRWRTCPWFFLGCMSGPVPARAECLTPFDADGDGDVDIADLAKMISFIARPASRVASGPRAVSPRCAACFVNLCHVKTWGDL